MNWTALAADPWAATSAAAWAGLSLDAALSLSGPGGAIADGDTDAAGSVPYNSTRAYTITNDGDADATGVVVTPPAGTTLVSAPTTVPAGESRTFTLRFTTAGATVNGTVSVASDDPASPLAYTLTATVGAIPVVAPGGLSASLGDVEVSLSWDAVTGADHYNVYRGGVLVGSPADPEFAESVPADARYSYTVTAVNADDVESQPAAVRVNAKAGGGSGSGQTHSLSL